VDNLLRMVRGAGLEPARYCYHQPLKLACLPFHHPRIGDYRISGRGGESGADLRRYLVAGDAAFAGGAAGATGSVTVFALGITLDPPNG
jgi:hypothetical protein